MYSVDVRKLACHIYSLLHSLRKTSLLVCASHSSVSRWVKSIERKPYDSSRRRDKRNVVSEALRAAVLADPLLSLSQLRSKVKDVTGVLVSRELLRLVLKNSNFSRKKARFYGTSPSLPERTREFLQMRAIFQKQGRAFYSVDEAGFGRHRHPVYGYAPSGHRVLLRKNCTRESNTSVIACISSERLHSVCMSRHPVKARDFLEFMHFGVG